MKKAANKKTIALIVAGVLLVLLVLKDWSFFGGPVSGLVMDQATDRPIAGAIVVVRWDGSWSKGFVESSNRCYGIRSARTDANGHYSIPFWIRTPRLSDLVFSDYGTEVSIFKPGYVDKSEGKTGKVFMQPFTGTNEEYFSKVLDRRRWICAGGLNDTSATYRAFRAAAGDANARAITPEQQTIAWELEAMARESLTDLSKPHHYSRGAETNIDPNDSFEPKE